MRSAILASIVLQSLILQSLAADQDQLAFFENEIRPLLIERCVKCHGPKKSESGLRLDTIELARKGGEGGPALIPGQPDDSLVIKAVRHEDGLMMPPDKRLPQREVAALVRWVRDGAVWPDGMKLAQAGPKVRGGPITNVERGFWSFQPVADPKPPEIDGDESLVRNDIDRFLAARLQAAGLKAAPPANWRTLLRRATFGLTGLPPTPEAIEAFGRDRLRQPDTAFRTLIDRLLASKAYGERWGRHWLDVVRYADTAGETGDYPTPLSYKYRNWVIDSFNKDKPYDEFIREQIAGDILAEEMINASGSSTDDETLARYRDMITATGFIAISRRFGFDVENYHHLTIQDTIDTLGQSVLGLSLGCARCHDHKYDPVNTNDYYAWYGIFESTRYSFPGSEQKKRPYDSFPVLPKQLAASRKAKHDARLVSIDAELKKQTAIKAAAEATLKGDNTSVFVGFEALPIGKGMPEPWGFLEDVKVVRVAQSPYENVFPKGERGLAMPSNAGNNAFGRPLPMAYTPATTPVLYYNIDFRLTELNDNGGGAFRFYLGRGPGNSGAVELSASATTFFVRNGGRFEPVCDLKIGEWYNVQVTADLRERKFSGTIGTPGKLIEFHEINFKDGWDGTIDRTFVDKYGASGGTIPARHFDNLSIRTTPHLPVGQSIRKAMAQSATSRWQSYVEGRRLLTAVRDRQGHAGFHVWHGGGDLPVIGVNTSTKTLKVPGTVEPGQLVVHPNPKEGVGIAWRSPITGRVRISGRVQDAHNCGDSVIWNVDHMAASGFKSVATGSVSTNGSDDLMKDGRPIEVDVVQGEFIQLAIMPKAHYGCDLTQVDLTITETRGPKRTWNLVSDVIDDFTDEHPNDDQYGNAVWYYDTVAVDRGQSFDVSPAGRLSDIDELAIRTRIKDASDRIAALTEEQNRLRSVGPYEVIYGAIEQDKPTDSRIRIRGNRRKLGDVVPRKNLEILGNDPLPNDAGSGRLQLADWMTRPDNPLTARVMVNRIWQQHFGRGLVGTENDFGARGERPTHPQLLDWLATRFRESGWSIKAMHRLIMTSAAYRRSSRFDEAASQKDPDSRLLWRFNRRRLSAEEIRDAMLFVSGELDRSPGGKHPFPPVESWSFSQHAPYYGIYPTKKRSIYLMQQRLKRHPFLALFDGADPNVSTARRELTTVPTQALFLMNNEFVHEQAAGLAQRLMMATNDEVQRLELAWLTTFARSPDENEIKAARDFLSDYRSALDETNMPKPGHIQIAWAAFARTLLTRNEFLFLD